MKSPNKKNHRDFKIEILEGKKRYMTQAMEFRRRLLEEKQKTSESRKKKKLY